jgi:hypothetical protein
MFVNPFHPGRGGREQPVDIIDSTDEYFPLQTREGLVVVSKSSVAELDYVATHEQVEAGSLAVGVRVSLNVTMTGGKSYSGVVWVEGPVNTPRLLDFMTRMAGRNQKFLVLHSKNRVRLLNRTHIETIRPTD